MAWQKLLGRMLNDFFGEQNDEDGRLQKIRDALAELAEQAGEMEDPLSIELVKQWLEVRLGTESRHGRYFSGGVSFCGMLPMRSLPFKVICLLGMNEAAFPRRKQYTEFDLMRQHWRPGDPGKSDEDRYLFLETLLCARQCLYISYTGRDIRKNSERQPSVLVRELLDYIDQRYGVKGNSKETKTSGILSCVHPLQPFSARNYAGDNRSYDPYWCSVAHAITTPGLPATGEGARSWSDIVLPAAADSMRKVSLARLLRFARNPVRYFVQTRLQLYLHDERPGEDDEIFEFDWLQKYRLEQRFLDDRLDGHETSARRLAAEGSLPHGPMADIAWAQSRTALDTVLERIEPFEHMRAEPQLIQLEFQDIDGATIELSGQVRRFYPGLGLLHYSPGKLKGANLLAMWIEHLACRAMGIADHPASVLHSVNESFSVLGRCSGEEALYQLSHYLSWYWRGLHRPLLVLPGATYEYAKTASGSSSANPMSAAGKKWEGSSFMETPGDKDDASIQLIRRGLEGSPLEHPDFVPLAQGFYDQLLAAGDFS